MIVLLPISICAPVLRFWDDDTDDSTQASTFCQLYQFIGGASQPANPFFFIRSREQIRSDCLFKQKPFAVISMPPSKSGKRRKWKKDGRREKQRCQDFFLSRNNERKKKVLFFSSSVRCDRLVGCVISPDVKQPVKLRFQGSARQAAMILQIKLDLRLFPSKHDL